MALTNDEREQIRYHLGYMQVTAASAIQLGIPRPTTTIFLVEDAMSNLREAAEPRVRSILGILADVETKLVASQDRLAALKLGNLELRGVKPGTSEGDGLEYEYTRWAGRLADILGVPFYPGSHRFANSGSNVNVSVSN